MSTPAEKCAERLFLTPHSRLGKDEDEWKAAVASIIQSEYASIEQENQRLREALEWYADASNYHDSDTAIEALKFSYADMDKGQRARKALRGPRQPRNYRRCLSCGECRDVDVIGKCICGGNKFIDCTT